jgi:hypothetical protein
MTIEEKMKQVPFGNSTFQILNFTAKQESPERIYRNVLLQLDAKNKAMKECYFRRKKREIDIKEIDEKLLTATGFEKERLLISKEEAEFYLNDEIKLIEDCIIEIKTYEKIIEDLPEFTREDFESSENIYWKKRLLKQAKFEIQSSNTISFGVIESLNKLGLDVTRNHQGQLTVMGLSKEDAILLGIEKSTGGKLE